MPSAPDLSAGSRVRELWGWATSVEGTVTLCAVGIVAVLLLYAFTGLGDYHHDFDPPLIGP